jgi:hypothetical protein
MTRPLFLSIEDVMEIHADQIQRYGGSLGIRDVELLHSALGMPEAGFGDQYLHAGLFEMAAAYLYHIVQNHPCRLLPRKYQVITRRRHIRTAAAIRCACA